MDLRIWDGAREIDLLKPDGSTLTGGFVIPDFIKFYNVTDTVRFENTGNVPFTFKIFRFDLLDTLQVGETFVVGFKVDTIIMFDSGGIVRDLLRLPRYSDGKTYIRLVWNR